MTSRTQTSAPTSAPPSPSTELHNLAKIGQLKVEATNPAEITRLINMATLRLQDAKQTTLSIEGRYLAAYAAAHAVALAALRQHGFRSTNRYLVFQLLQHTLGWPPEQWRQLDHAHHQRNLAEYEGFLDVAPSQVDALIALAHALSTAFKPTHPIRAETP